MNDRDTILQRVSAALDPLPERAALPDWDRDLIHRREASPVTDLWREFAAQMQAVNGTVMESKSELAGFLQAQGWTHGYCDPALAPEFADVLGAGFTVETKFDRTRIDDYAFGITRAVGAIAETGTLILGDNTSSSRLAALTPWVHIAVLHPANIHPDITSALANLPSDPNLIWVTGPSKTADVEGILIEGVHGPGIQIAMRDGS